MRIYSIVCKPGQHDGRTEDRSKRDIIISVYQERVIDQFLAAFSFVKQRKTECRERPETAQIRWSHRKSCPIVLCDHEQTSSSSLLSTLSSSSSIPDQISCGRVMSIKLRCPQNYCPCAVACNDNAHSVTVCSCAWERTYSQYNSFGMNADIVQAQAKRPASETGTCSTFGRETLDYDDAKTSCPKCRESGQRPDVLTGHIARQNGRQHWFCVKYNGYCVRLNVVATKRRAYTKVAYISCVFVWEILRAVKLFHYVLESQNIRRRGIIITIQW